MASKYRFDEARAEIITFLERDWPPTLDKLYSVQVDIMQLQAAVDIFAHLDRLDDIDDPDLLGEPFRQVPPNRLSDEDIDRAAAMAVTLAIKFKIPSILAAATYRLYVRAKFRTSYRRSGRMAQEFHRGAMTNDLDKLASYIPDDMLDSAPLKSIAGLVSYWVEKKFKRQCSDCERAESERAKGTATRTKTQRKAGVGAEEEIGSIKTPLPPFVNLHVCEPDPLVLLRSESIKYFRETRATDSNSVYCEKCWGVLKKEIDAWAHRLWDEVFTKLELNPSEIMKVRTIPSSFLICKWKTLQTSPI